MSLKRHYSQTSVAVPSQEIEMPRYVKRRNSKSTRVLVRKPYRRSSMAGVKPKHGSIRPFVLSRSLRTPFILPDRMSTTLSTSMDIYWPAGVMTAAAGNYFDIWVNSNQPFSTNYPFTLGVGGGTTWACNATPVQGFSNTNRPLGWTNMSLWYTNYRVTKYRLEVTVDPQNTADTVRLVVFPLGLEEVPSSSAGSVNVRVMEGQPFAKSKTVAAATPSGAGENTLEFTGNCAADLGKTPTQYEDGPDVPVGGAPGAGYFDAVGVFLQQLNGANNIATVTCQMKLIQYVTFYDLIQPIN